MNILKKIVFCISVLVLASCKLIVTADEGGKVVSKSGSYNCNGTSCTFDVPADGLSETFTAVPDEGYVFTGWKGGGKCEKEVKATCTFDINPLFATMEGDTELIANFKLSPWDNKGLTGLWDVEMDPALIPVIQGLLGLSDPVSIIAPGGKWLIVEQLGQELVGATSCDTTAAIAAFFDRPNQTNEMEAIEFNLNFPDDPEFDTLNGMLATGEYTAFLTVIDDDHIELLSRIIKPLPMDIPATLTRSKTASTLQIGHASADLLEGGTACSYAKGSSDADFDLHLTTFYKSDFLRLRLDHMALGNKTLSLDAVLEAALTQHAADTINVNGATVEFTDNSAPDIGFSFGLNTSNADSRFTGKVEIPDLEINQ